MQAQVQKKDKSPVVRCPRCGAENVAAQDRCGRCGFVFPVEKAHRGQRVGARAPMMPGGAPPTAGAPEPSFSGGDWMDGTEMAEPGQPPSGPVTPKKLLSRGVSEGLVRDRGAWKNCPRCGADLKPDAKRCIRCGFKP